MDVNPVIIMNPAFKSRGYLHSYGLQGQSPQSVLEEQELQPSLSVSEMATGKEEIILNEFLK